MEELKVQKRNGRLVNIDFAKVQNRIKKASKGLKVNYLEVAAKVIQGLYDGVTTKELDKLAAETAAANITQHPDYSWLASQIAISALDKESCKDFQEVFEILKKEQLLNSEYISRVEQYGPEEISQKIDYSLDFNIDYFGFKTLEKSYLLGIKVNGVTRILERPQDLYMRVAITCTTTKEEAFETYDKLSQHYYTHATPTLFNSGLREQQLASCFLLLNKADSKFGILDTVRDISVISAGAGGIGVAIHNLRAKGSTIHSSNGVSGGIMPYLKLLNASANYWDQGGGKRKGSFAVYLEPWHSDIFTLLEIRKTHGSEDLRARDLFPAIWAPDLFMQRVEENGEWCLTCPNEQIKAGFKPLYSIHSKDFNEEYLKIEDAVREGKMPGKILKGGARELWTAILEAQMETGVPYLLYKDAANSKSNQQNLGTISSSNLCIDGRADIQARVEGECIGVKLQDLNKMYRQGVPVEILSYNETTGQKEYKKVLASKCTSRAAEVLKVITSDGFEIICTPEHQILTKRGWVQAKDLQECDDIVKG